jgi:DNA-binding FadR family transcriptional regulator
VQSQLFAAIANGEYPPGALLPSERVLCEMFQISRVSIREALAGLAATGVVEIQQGKGAFVRPSVADEYAGPFGLYIERHRDELADLLQIRGALDGLAASRAADDPSKQVRDQISKACQAFAHAVDGKESPQQLTQLDVEFHEAIAACSGSRLLSDLLHELNSLLVESRHILFARPDQPSRSMKDHQGILDAILARDASTAQHRATAHVDKMWTWVRDFRSRRTFD